MTQHDPRAPHGRGREHGAPTDTVDVMVSIGWPLARADGRIAEVPIAVEEPHGWTLAGNVAPVLGRWRIDAQGLTVESFAVFEVKDVARDIALRSRDALQDPEGPSVCIIGGHAIAVASEKLRTAHAPTRSP